MAKVYISLGTNLGDKEQNLRTAVQKIEEQVGKVISLSAFYITAPWGKIFLFDCNRFYFDTSCVKRYPIFMAYDTQDFLEYTSQEIPATTDPVRHKPTSTVGRASSPFMA